MRFDARELKPYAHSVSKTELKENGIYFFLLFCDEESIVPELQPVVFIGRNLSPGDVGKVYFQDFDSHRRGISYPSEWKNTNPESQANQTIIKNGAEFFSGSEDDIGHVFEFEDALEELMHCSLRRRNLETD